MTDFKEGLKRDAALIEKRLSKLFVLSELMRLTPVEMLLAAHNFVLFATYRMKCSMNAAIDNMTLVLETQQTITSEGTPFDPPALAIETLMQCLKTNSLPGVTIDEVLPVPELSIESRMGWDSLVKGTK